MSTHRFLLLVAVAIASGCTDSGFGRFDGQVSGGPECLADILPFESEFQTAQSRDSSIRLYFQSDGGIPTGKDVFTFVGPPVSAITPGGSYAMTATGEDDTFVGTFIPGESCPDGSTSYYVTGTIVIDAFEGELDTPVTGSFDGGQVFDSRTDAVVMTGVSGSWDFNFEKGPPYEPYP